MEYTCLFLFVCLYVFLALLSTTKAKETEHLVLPKPVTWDVGTDPAQAADAPGTVFTKPQGAAVTSELSDGWSPGQQLLQMAIPLV